MKGEGVSLLLPPPASPASPDAGCDSALYKGPTSHSHVPSGIPVSVLASAGTSSIRPSPPLLSTNLRSLSKRSQDLTIDLFFLFGGKKKEILFSFQPGLPKEACPAPRYSLQHSHSDRSADRHKIPIKKRKSREVTRTEGKRSKNTCCSLSRVSAIIPSSPSAIFLENTSVCFS